MNISIAKDRIVDVSCVEEVFPMEEDSADNYWLKVPKLCGALIRVLFLCRISFFFGVQRRILLQSKCNPKLHICQCARIITFSSLS